MVSTPPILSETNSLRWSVRPLCKPTSSSPHHPDCIEVTDKNPPNILSLYSYTRTTHNANFMLLDSRELECWIRGNWRLDWHTKRENIGDGRYRRRRRDRRLEHSLPFGRAGHGYLGARSGRTRCGFHYAFRCAYPGSLPYDLGGGPGLGKP